MPIDKIVQETVTEVENVDYWVNYLTELGETYLPKVAAAILTLVIGWWLISRINRWFKKILIKREVEISLIPFLCSLVNALLKVLLLVTVASMVGIATTSFIAILGTASLAVGLALQGSLSNFAGGVIILLFKPFKVGDLIESDGIMGVVQSITVLNTILATPADNTAILPNGQVANNKVLNYTKENNRRVDLTIGIGYDEDIDKAKAVLLEAMKKVPKVLESPAPFVGIIGFGDSSVDLAVRPYAKSGEYWDVYFAANEAIKKTLDDNNIEIPYPHQVEIRK
ncbi:MAG TPA: mechanosensitive ion channel protein [Bacteroidetes bacterium]|nr:mechanosensitive ion channel protein [Bacteroidota bacterium]